MSLSLQECLVSADEEDSRSRRSKRAGQLQLSVQISDRTLLSAFLNNFYNEGHSTAARPVWLRRCDVTLSAHSSK